VSSDACNAETAFFTYVRDGEQAARARLVISSVRSFGGELGGCPFWIAAPDDAEIARTLFAEDGLHFVPLTVPSTLKGYHFSGKVCAAEAVERSVSASCRTLVWLIPESLITNPPVLFGLNGSEAAALRPVHISNVGLPADGEPDAFWSGIYEAVGEPDPSFTVESFIGGDRIRPYFNSAAYSVDPSRGLLGRWLELFVELVADRIFQRAACRDEWHRIFLHQAVFSTLLAVSAGIEGIRLLPPDYCYPYNLQERVPVERRARDLAELTCVIYEDRPIDPRTVEDVRFGDRLRNWLIGRLDHAGRAT
jgi:hypothetical protein